MIAQKKKVEAPVANYPYIQANDNLRPAIGFVASHCENCCHFRIDRTTFLGRRFALRTCDSGNDLAPMRFECQQFEPRHLERPGGA